MTYKIGGGGGLVNFSPQLNNLIEKVFSVAVVPINITVYNIQKQSLKELNILYIS